MNDPVAVDRLRDLYRRLEDDISRFSEASGAHCPEGCGSCCETFVPELTPPETALIAEFLLVRGQTITADSWVSGELPGACPFYRITGDPYHCGIYPVRPLICRLFGFAGNRDKQGRARFRPCRHMPLGQPAPGLKVPTMEEYGLELESLSPGGGRLGIGDAVRDALAALLLRESMRARETRETDEVRIAPAS